MEKRCVLLGRKVRARRQLQAANDNLSKVSTSLCSSSYFRAFTVLGPPYSNLSPLSTAEIARAVVAFVSAVAVFFSEVVAYTVMMPITSSSSTYLRISNNAFGEG
jgi:hypothetical protein